jgi:hypothetical protein
MLKFVKGTWPLATNLYWNRLTLGVKIRGLRFNFTFEMESYVVASFHSFCDWFDADALSIGTLVFSD